MPRYAIQGVVIGERVGVQVLAEAEPLPPDFDFVFTTEDPALTENLEKWVLIAVDTIGLPGDREVALHAKFAEIDARWDRAARDGIPVSVNGQSAVLRYTERDEARWARVWDPTKAPPGGLLVALQQPFNGKDELRIQGAPKIEAGKQAILDHVNAADTSWETARDEVQALYDGGSNASQISAYDVEAVDPPWPSNTI